MSKKVLIVEDNELNMKLFHDLLGAHGIDTVQTREGHKAFDMAVEHQPDLIIMDIQLPEISGLDITKRLKQSDAVKHIPVIAVTAFAMKGDEQKIREGGCQDYISKPISVSKFIDVILKHLENREYEKPAEQRQEHQEDANLNMGSKDETMNDRAEQISEEKYKKEHEDSPKEEHSKKEDI